jgi:transposase
VYPPDAKIAQLNHLIALNKPARNYILEELMTAKGHEVLRLPPYHSDLNPIELSWSFQKRYVQDHLTGSSGN